MRLKVKRMVDGTEEVDVKLLPDGRACIHLLLADGPIAIEPHPSLRHNQPATYKIACREQQMSIRSQKRGNIRFVCLTTSEVGSATCPDCLKVVGA